MNIDNRAYKCTWAKGKDVVTKGVTFEFFCRFNSYHENEIDEVDQLQPGQSANFSNYDIDHFVRRIK